VLAGTTHATRAARVGGGVRTAARRGLLAAVTVGSLLCVTPPALARDAKVRSFDGTTILAHFTPASNRGANERVPTVLVGPGYPTPGDTNPDGDTSDQIGQATLRANGYNVLTWDPRGIGGSGGTVTFDSPAFEARDVQALIDYVAQQPEAMLDAPNDPRVGMSGSSYGGGIQLATAAIDGRLDAIVPDVTWNALGQAFFPDAATRTPWSVIICGNGSASGLPGNLLGPAAAVLQRADAQLKQACVESLGGAVSANSRQWFADRTPPGLREAINTPTLITQGTVDTLFDLQQGIDNYNVLRDKGVPVKMMWYCGGHGICTTPTGDPGHIKAAGLAWLNRWLKRDTSVDTGPAFEWLADDGVWRSGPDYPLGDAGTIDATGSNFPSLGISLLDGAQSGTSFAATPASNAVNLEFTPPPANSDIVGAPHVKLTYKGNALSPETFLYAQIVDIGANRVLGSQVTPIPVRLDDRVHSVERDLAPVAAHAGAGARYKLQITPGTAVFSDQRSLGGVTLQQVDATLPLVDPTRSARGDTNLRTPVRLKVTVTSKRVNGRARVVIRSRLRSVPCAGTVTFTVSAAGKSTRYTVAVPSSCKIQQIVRLKVRGGRVIKVSTKFNGNSQLKARSARAVSVRVK
jgi:ABC-2 type transport system ATP-binding protein